MRTPLSAPLEEAVLAIAGLQDGQKPSCLHSSLPSELCFNSLRDASRRGKKANMQSPAAMHCVSWKTATQHSFGSESLTLSDFDWASSLKRYEIKTSVHSSLRATDRSMGIDCHGLTRSRTNRWYTKPHIFTQRLHLLSALSTVYNEQLSGTVPDKTHDILKLYDNMWISKLVPEMNFVRFKGEDAELPDTALLATCSGPHTVGCIKLRLECGTYAVNTRNPRTYIIVDYLDKVEIACAKPVVQNGLQWEKSSEWMSVVDWVADYGILSITATLLTSLVQKMGLKPGRLDHKHRVEFFLRHLKRPDAYIEEVLLLLPEPKTRKRARPSGAEQQLDPVAWQLKVLIHLIINQSIHTSSMSKTSKEKIR